MTQREPGDLATMRVLCAVACGLAAGAIALVEAASWSVAALCASDVAALVFVAWVWWTTYHVENRGVSVMAARGISEKL